MKKRKPRLRAYYNNISEMQTQLHSRGVGLSNFVKHYKTSKTIAHVTFL